MASTILQKIFNNDPHGLLNINAYKIKYQDGSVEVVVAGSVKEVVQKYDLATRQHIKTKVIELQGKERDEAIEAWRQF